MDLRTYVEQQDGTWGESTPTLVKLAKAAGIKPSHLYRVAIGSSVPGGGHRMLAAVTAIKIAKATNYVIGLNDLRPDLWSKRNG